MLAGGPRSRIAKRRVMSRTKFDQEGFWRQGANLELVRRDLSFEGQL
ncbi:hypothetical protein PLANPX_2887 [Lacipirellula parvula]|uniref:Uncharacterized protein n=1 Tax=Lacipirellula parvula TaxID=2650471 RepID=A0A5K7XA37_9BACT|nr:hypothetical protein PLANPX_2887 [Lacipirellula parvula]